MSQRNVNIHRHQPPTWFKQADLGIFIHWGLYSVPAFAPVATADFGELMQHQSLRYLYEHTPYAEWYANSIQIKGTAAYQYHHDHYGNQPYSQFAQTFQKSARHVDPKAWVQAFVQAGAKYVVLVTKHHDGFLLFNSHQKNPNIADYQLDFDFVGDLAKACRQVGLRFGVYYSSLLDWTFTTKPIRNGADLLLGNNNSKAYMDYCYNHWVELIDRYHPDILWSDIGYPADKRLPALFDYYYQAVPDGMVNDRWGQYPNILRHPPMRALFNLVANVVNRRRNQQNTLPKAKYYDYRTLEYSLPTWPDKQTYFEICRGMDKSFGYNQFSRPEDYITAAEVQQIIAQAVPQNGRLLLNVGPDQNGTIPPYQLQILKELAQNRGT
ncbi:MAG: alpha-L-fucosidase [Lactobacillus sp.]|jgi:alpha-L-fucosidase|nr:alpha-L-fucosidase [Lactobacillus sp.]